MKAEFVQNTNNDLMIANVARVSFNKWNKELDMSLNPKNKPKDPALIKYLADHKHISPFFHPRITLILPKMALDLYDINDPTYLMGAVWERYNDRFIKFRTSYYGWVKLLQDKIIHPYYAFNVYQALTTGTAFKYANQAFNLEEPAALWEEKFVEINEHNPFFIDYSIRIQCPIPIARQMFTHRMFVSNEVSRRYVDTTPDIYTPDQWRTRPEGSIKQGSGSIWDTPNFWTEDPDGVDAPLEEVYQYYMDQSLSFYNDMVNKGIAPEQARFVLPQAMETSFIFTGSAVSWARLLQSRFDTHAQKEIQYLAEQILQELTANGFDFTEHSKQT